MSIRSHPAPGATCRLGIRVKPRAKRTRSLGFEAETLVVAVAAPPVDGSANQELLRYLGRRLSVPQKSLKLTAGLASKNKLLSIEGLTLEVVRGLLAEPDP